MTHWGDITTCARELADRERAAALEQLAAENKALRAQLADWQASQHYRYIGADGKPVLARELEDRLIAAEAEAARLRADAENIAEQRNDAIKRAEVAETVYRGLLPHTYALRSILTARNITEARKIARQALGEE